MPDVWVIIVVLVVMASAGDWLTKRAARRNAVVALVAETRQEPLPDPARDYLTRLDGSLALPDSVRREIELELRDHLEDSIAAIETEGLDRERATREALARLGRPEELGRQLRVAHRSGRRLLAGAAGGVFSAAGGVLFGFVAGYAIVMIALILGALVVSLTIARYLPPVDSTAMAFGTIFASVIAYVPAFMAARRAVAASAAISERDPKRLAVGWAMVGGLGVVAFMLFVLSAEQSWAAVPFELGIAVAFVVGALFRPSFHVPRLQVERAIALFLGATAVTIVLGMMAFSSGGTTSSGSPEPEAGPAARHFDHIAPTAQDGTYITQGSWWPGKPAMEFDVHDPTALAGWTRLQFEAWRASCPADRPAGLCDVDTRFDAPYAVQAVDQVAKKITTTVDMSRVRTSEWIVVVTGVGPDGKRYRLTPDTGTIQSHFSGTVWQWLTATD